VAEAVAGAEIEGADETEGGEDKVDICKVSLLEPDECRGVEVACGLGGLLGGGPRGGPVGGPKG